MAMFEVNCRVLDNENYTTDDYKLAHRYLDQICDELAAGAYVEGNRNNITVDLACMCHVLELDPMDVAFKAWADAPSYARDQAHLKEDLDRIKMYLCLWDWGSRNGVFDYMIGWYSREVEPGEKWIKLVNCND